MPIYLVRPREPTVLSHKEYHEISSTNLLLSLTVSTVHIIPEILDIERFNVALSDTLSSFPLPAGKLVRPNTPGVPWMIRLTNSGLPVSVTESDTDEIFPTNLTVQSSLSRYVDPLNITGIVNTEGESGEPLSRLTITCFTKLNSTSIGASHSHALFDGSGAVLFFELLSRLYQGLGPIGPPPYYEPEAIKFMEPLRPSSPICDCFDPLAAMPPWEQPERKAMEFVAFRLTATQLTEIHDCIMKGKEHPKTTRMDTLVGLLARCLSEVDSEFKPIDTILYVVNHRGMGIYPVNAVVNAIFWLPTGPKVMRGVDPYDDVLANATEIRKSLDKLKDPVFVGEMAAGVAKIQSQVAWGKSSQDIANPREGYMIVNIGRRLGWTSAHFGHPGKVRFYTSHTAGSRYVQIDSPNPNFIDGAWVSREDEIEATLYVPPNRRKRFETSFERCAKGFGMTGSVEFLS